MIRRTLAIALPLAAVLLTGCSTFSDSDNVARVGDATLSADDFQATLSSVGAPEDQPLPGDAVRAQITTWIQQQFADADTPDVSPEEAAETYDAGIETSGTACISAIIVTDEESATRVAEDLTGGADFDEVLSAENIEPSLGDAGGDLGCVTSEQALQAGDVEYVQTALALDASDPIGTAPLVNNEGAEIAWIVMKFRSFTELSDADAATVTATIGTRNRAATADVWVDPRYGTWDPAAGQVVALG